MVKFIPLNWQCCFLPTGFHWTVQFYYHWHTPRSGERLMACVCWLTATNKPHPPSVGWKVTHVIPSTHWNIGCRKDEHLLSKEKKTSRFQPQMFGKYPMTDIHKPPGSLPKKQFLANYDYWWLLYFQKLFYIYQTNIIQTYPSQLHPVPIKALFMFYDFHDMSITLPSRLGSSKIAPNSLQPP